MIKWEKISVIMSAYNAECTIERAVNSVMASTYPNLELIIVDDKSTDNTIEIIKRLQKVYKNIILIRHRRNKGAGLARRSGIEASTGDFLTFVDSDDEIDKNLLSVLYSHITKYNVSIVISSVQVITKEADKVNPVITSVDYHEGKDVLTKDISKKKFLNGSLSRKSCWNNINYSSLRFIEDTPTMYKLLNYCRSCCLLDYNGYYYYQNPGSICHTAAPIKIIVYRLLGLIELLSFDESTFNKDVDRRAFMLLFKDLTEVLEKTSYKEIYKYRKELFRIFQYFINKILL